MPSEDPTLRVPPRSKCRRLAALALRSLLALVVVDQAIEWTALRDGALLGRRIAPFDPPLFTAEQAASLERLRASAELATAGREGSGAGFGVVRWDPLLGWDSPRSMALSDSWYDAL